MKYLLSIVLMILMIGCSKENPMSLKENIDASILDKKVFELELDTWSADDLAGWQTRGGQLIVYTITERFSQNWSDKYYNVDESLHRGIVLYQLVSDTVAVLGYGGGKIVDGFGRRKELIYPGEAYRHVSRIDSVWIVSGLTIYYTNFWYEGEFDFNQGSNNEVSPLLGKKLTLIMKNKE
jgi:hypothetical protein